MTKSSRNYKTLEVAHIEQPPLFGIMQQQRVLLGFSGGIDSCASVDILRDEGYSVHALTIDTIGDKRMVSEAEAAAKRLGVEWVYYDAVECFQREIIDYFCEEYYAGHTPAPCTRCNTHIKWRILCEVADRLGIEHIATGHYFNIVERNSRLYVAKGLDPAKDQSYYLWGLSQQILRRAITPMGNRIKENVKRESAIRGESMGICFLRGQHYSDFLRDRGYCTECGDIVNSEGVVVGQHRGIANYTIGQKRGEGIPSGASVIGIDAKQNRIQVGDNGLLLKHRLYVNNCNIVDESEFLTSTDITIKIRGIGRNPQLAVAIQPYEDGYIVTTNDAAWAPAVGQPVVFYRQDLVVGGGILAKSE